MRNLLVSFRSSVEGLRHRPCFRYFENGTWLTLSWLEVWDRVRDLALGLRALGIRPGDRVAIVSGTRYEWTVIDLSVLSLGAVTVPIYTASTPEQIDYILTNSGARAVALENREQLKKLETLRSRRRALK